MRRMFERREIAKLLGQGAIQKIGEYLLVALLFAAGWLVAYFVSRGEGQPAMTRWDWVYITFLAAGGILLLLWGVALLIPKVVDAVRSLKGGSSQGKLAGDLSVLINRNVAVETTRPLGDTLQATATIKDQSHVGTHPTDVADKIKATKEILRFLQTDAHVATEVARALASSWKDVRSDEDAKAFVIRLGEFATSIDQFYTRLDDMAYRHREYDHLPQAISNPPEREPLSNLSGKFANALMDTRNPALIEPFADAWMRWFVRWRVWRTDAENRLIELKRQLSR